MVNKQIIGLFILFTALEAKSQQPLPVAGQALPAWQEGYMDLHHINTGRGNAAFFILPDGTTMVVDAGENDPTEARTMSPRNTVIRPDDSKKPFEWIVDYIRQFAPAKNKELDYALITHFHDDHFGGWYPDAPASADHKFQRTGITGVGDLLPVHHFLTRDYNYPVSPDTLLQLLPKESHFPHTWANYRQFLQSENEKGQFNDFLRAGSATQIHLVHHADRFPDFQVRNLKSNGWIWTGKDSSVKQHFPPIDPSNPHSWPDENTLSNAILLTYGDFRYYTGGDNTGNVFLGDSAWRDVETEIAAATGRVDVATMDHHGNRDGENPVFIQTLRPRVWVEQTWTADHPGHEVLIRIMSRLYDGPRDLFATNMMEANKLVIGPLIDQSYKGTQGHILVRVMPGGHSYYVIMLDDSTTDRKVKAVFGPYITARNYTTANAHAHNDYVHEHPFTTAYGEKFGSMEADIFLYNDSLIVGHTKEDIARHRTLQQLYLDPLQQQVQLHHGYPYSDTSRRLQLLIDLKTEGVPTLQRLVQVLKKYPALTQCSHIKFVMTGNRPGPSGFNPYPSFIWFDGEFDKTYDAKRLKRVAVFSDNFARYSSWNGQGMMPLQDRKALDSLIDLAHRNGSKVRLWNAPDNENAWLQLMDAGVDFINTDHIKELSLFFDKLPRKL